MFLSGYDGYCSPVLTRTCNQTLCLTTKLYRRDEIDLALISRSTMETIPISAWHVSYFALCMHACDSRMRTFLAERPAGNRVRRVRDDHCCCLFLCHVLSGEKREEDDKMKEKKNKNPCCVLPRPWLPWVCAVLTRRELNAIPGHWIIRSCVFQRAPVSTLPDRAHMSFTASFTWVRSCGVALCCFLQPCMNKNILRCLRGQKIARN